MSFHVGNSSYVNLAKYDVQRVSLDRRLKIFTEMEMLKKHQEPYRDRFLRDKEEKLYDNNT